MSWFSHFSCFSFVLKLQFFSNRSLFAVKFFFIFQLKSCICFHKRYFFLLKITTKRSLYRRRKKHRTLKWKWARLWAIIQCLLYLFIHLFNFCSLFLPFFLFSCPHCETTKIIQITLYFILVKFRCLCCCCFSFWIFVVVSSIFFFISFVFHEFGMKKGFVFRESRAEFI